MAAMRRVHIDNQLPPHAHVREGPREYAIGVGVSDFAESELTVEACGPRLTVRDDQSETDEDA